MTAEMGKQHIGFASGLRDLIIECAGSYELIEMHAEFQRDGSFYCGRVAEVEDDRFRMVYVDPLGAPGSKGVLDAWFGFDEVGFVRRGTAYLRGLERLIPVHERFTSLPKGKYRRKLKGIRKLLSEASISRSVVTITIDEGNYNLRVESVDKEAAYGALLEDDGSCSGRLAIRFDQITRARRGAWEAAIEWLSDQQPSGTPS